jgi:2-aminoadipate transaminase
MQRALANPSLISLAAGFVDQASLPVGEVARVAAAVLADPSEGRRALQYGTTPGDLRLRTLLVRYLERSEGAPAGAFEPIIPRTIVTAGSQQLLYLVAEALLDPGDIVLVEAPTYFVFMGILASRGVRAIGIAIDEGGLRLDRLESTLQAIEAEGQLDRVKLIYTISEHSNPSGLSLAAERRGSLVELAKRWSKRQPIFILEDAAYRGLRFEGVEPPSVWRHDGDGQTVILARTFSKTLSPGLKLGYGVLPEALLDPVLYLKGNHDFGSAHFNQQVVERLLADGSYERHVARLVAIYRRKRDVVLEALEDRFGRMARAGEVSWTRPRGGLFVWLTLPEGTDTGREGPFFDRCLEHGVLFVPGAYAFAPEPGPVPTNHLRLSFGMGSPENLVEGVHRLAAALVATRKRAVSPQLSALG